MSKGLFPNGPIGFNVHGHGFQEGLPMIHALVAVKNKDTPVIVECEFIKKDGSWSCRGRPMSQEEQDMVQSIWDDKYGR